LCAGDEILGVDGYRFGVGDYRRVAELLPKGPLTAFALTVRRGGSRRAVPFEEEDAEADGASAAPHLPPAAGPKAAELSIDEEGHKEEGEEEEWRGRFIERRRAERPAVSRWMRLNATAGALGDELTSAELAAKRARHFLLGQPYATAATSSLSASELRAMEGAAVSLIQRRVRAGRRPARTKLRSDAFGADARRARGSASGFLAQFLLPGAGVTEASPAMLAGMTEASPAMLLEAAGMAEASAAMLLGAAGVEALPSTSEKPGGQQASEGLAEQRSPQDDEAIVEAALASARLAREGRGGRRRPHSSSSRSQRA